MIVGDIVKYPLHDLKGEVHQISRSMPMEGLSHILVFKIRWDSPLRGTHFWLYSPKEIQQEGICVVKVSRKQIS
jgi:hypothetical protein